MPAELIASPKENPMEELLEQYLSCQRLERGQIVPGVVIRVGSNSIIVDVGAKCEGIVPAEDFERLSPEEQADVQPGADVMVYVVNLEDDSDNLVLSLTRAQIFRDWQEAQHLLESQKVVESEVVGSNKGGVIVNIGRLRGFVPGSQLAATHFAGQARDDAQGEERWQALVGETLQLKVIEVDQARNRLIMSERAAVKDWRKSQREQILEELTEGTSRRGRVINLADFGAFVDLGGIDGLVHLSELSWKRIAHPREVVEVGQEIDVYVLGIDRERQRIALSVKRLLPDPWTTVEERYQTGQLLEAVITRLTKWGAFASIAGDEAIEGLIHISELDDRHIAHPRETVQPNQVVTLRVLDVDASHHRLALSLKQVASGEFLEQDWGAALTSEQPSYEGALSAALTEALSPGDEASLGTEA